MTKLSTRNAKDTIIELVIIVRIVVTHKMLEFEDVNPTVTLWPFLASRDFNSRPICRNFFPEQIVSGKAISIAGLSAGIHFSNSDLR